MRGIFSGMVDDVLGHNKSRFIEVISARVEVAVEPGKIAARNLDPDLVSGAKKVARGLKVDLESIDLSLLHPDLSIETFPVPGS